MNARFVTQTLTGVQRYAFEICRQLILQKPDLILLRSNEEQQAWSLALPTTVIGKRKGHLWEQTDLYRFMRKRPEAMLLNLANTAPLFLRNQMVCIHDLAFLHKPYSVTTTFRLAYTFFVKTFIHRAKAIITVSNTVKQELMKTYGLNSDRILVAGNGLPTSLPSAHVQKEKIILSVGSLNRRKRIDALVHAFIQSKLLADYTLIHIGSHAEMYQPLKLPKHARVVFLEQVSDPELWSYYQRAALFVSPSAYEGFGIPVLEALYFRCKVLCSDIPVYRELFSKYVYFCDMKTGSLQHNLEQLIELPLTDVSDLAETFSYARSAANILYRLHS